MADIRAWWNGHKPTARRMAQLYSALLYNANLKGLVDGKLYTGPVKAVCAPGLNCYSCPAAVTACPLGSLQNALSSSGHTVGWYVFGILLLFGVTLGRTICGWLCPMGLAQELLHRIPTPKIKKSRITRALTVLKYLILSIFVVALPLIYGLARQMPLPAFCKYICPTGTSEGALLLLANPGNSGMLAQLGVLFTRKFVILLALGLACIFCYRAFCRFLCPLGAIYSLFQRFALVGVRVDAHRCNHCGACVRQCPMDIQKVSDRECIACGRCISHCAQGAISIQCGKLTLKSADGHEKQPSARERSKHAGTGRVLWGALWALLLCVMVVIPLTDTPREAAAVMDTSATAPATTEPNSPEGTALPALTFRESEAPIGFQVGQRLEDFSCKLMDGSDFHLADTLGSIVVINQWATYCTPCVGELPYFERLQEEHPEVVVLAFHHWLESSPKAVPFIEEKGWKDWKLSFTVDTKDQNIMRKIGGDNTMPRTVVLSRSGLVVYNEQRSVTYDMLLALLEMAEKSE